MSAGAGRIAPLTGAAFVVLAIVGFMIAGEPPDAEEENVRDLVEHYTDDEKKVFLGAALAALGAGLFVFFGGYLRTVLRERGGDTGFLPTVAIAGTIIIATGIAIDSTITFALAELADDVPEESVLALAALWENDFVPMAMGNFVFLMATGLSIVRGSGAWLPKWAGWIAVVASLTSLTPIGFVAFIGMGLMVLVTSIVMAVRRAPSTA